MLLRFNYILERERVIRKNICLNGVGARSSDGKRFLYFEVHVEMPQVCFTKGMDKDIRLSAQHRKSYCPTSWSISSYKLHTFEK